MVDRRQFLKYALAGTCGSVVHQTFGPRLVTKAFAQSGDPSIRDGMLCVINLGGGASLNRAPIYHSAWLDKNPALAYTQGNSLPIAADQGLHPRLTFFKELFDDGDLCVINKVGYENHSRSHEIASARWMTATNIDDSKRQGVLNAISCELDGLLPAVSLSGSQFIAEGSCAEMRSMHSIAGFEGIAVTGGGDETAHFNMARRRFMDKIPADQLSGELARYVKDSVDSTDSLIQQVLPLIRPASPIAKPNSVTNNGAGLINDMLDIGRFFRSQAGLGIQAAYTSMGGFDTHSNERVSLNNLMIDLNSAVKYLVDSAKVDGYFDKLVILIMSEFGRTFQNDSDVPGNDHGGPSPVFLIGGKVNGRQVNAAPTQSEIASANTFLRDMDIDTRSLWYNVLWNGLGIDPTNAIGSPNDSPFSMSNLNLFI